MGYLDEKAYLSSSFRPEVVANNIVRSTTTAQDVKVDLDPVVKKLGFDLAELSDTLKTIAQLNTDALAKHAGSLETVRNEWQTLIPALENAKGTQKRLTRDFIKPYERARALVKTASSLHSTAILIRPLALYLSYSQTALATSAPAKKRAAAFVALSDLEVINVSAVQRLGPKLDTAKTELIAELKNKLSESFSNEEALEALTVLYGKEKTSELSKFFSERIKVMIGTAVSQISKNMTAPLSLDQTLKDLQSKADTIDKLQTSSGMDFEVSFWKAVAHQLDQKLKTMRVANPSVIKSLAQNSEEVLNSCSTYPEIATVFKKYV